MSIKTPENFKINKLPLVPTNNFNPRHICNNKKRRNNSKKISEKNNLGKLSGSYQRKANYIFKLSSLTSTIEVNKNTSGNNSYQNQILPNQNLVNENKNEIQDTKEKLTVNKTNLRGLKTKIDKNKSFVIRNEKRELSFNKRDITPSLLKHISLRGKNKNTGNNNYFKHLDSNSAMSLLEANLSIKPAFLQYDFEKLKLKHNRNAQMINNNILDDYRKDYLNKNKVENNNNYINEENSKNNNNSNNLKNINNKNKGNNNLYIKINNNLLKLNNNRHHLHSNIQKVNNTEEYFYENEEKEIELTKDEKIIFGNRTMKKYYKKKLLGKGGCGIVWLCYKSDLNSDDIDTNEYAVKQISKKTNSNNLSLFNININEDNLKIARNEIKILKALNENNIINENEKNSRICDVIPKLYDFYEDNNDIWFSFEKGGKSLSSLSYKIKGEFEKGERIYNIQKGIFLKLLFTNIKQFKLFIKKILEGIEFINDNGIIHSDIKPENILIEYNNDDNFEINSIKIIDYGSAFYYENTSAISSNTPEYLCPEITNNNKKFLKDLSKDKNYINSIDIWSFGITLLELCLCCPIWMSYKSKITINGKSFYSLGYFGCKGRDGNKIYQKQIELSKNLGKILKNSLLYLLNKDDREKFTNLLSGMLEFDYKKRIDIKDALEHEFLIDE
jgi:serine/threonine protein kinase